MMALQQNIKTSANQLENMKGGDAHTCKGRIYKKEELSEKWWKKNRWRKENWTRNTKKEKEDDQHKET